MELTETEKRLIEIYREGDPTYMVLFNTILEFHDKPEEQEE